jgi:hypothetical protein
MTFVFGRSQAQTADAFTFFSFLPYGYSCSLRCCVCCSEYFHYLPVCIWPFVRRVPSVPSISVSTHPFPSFRLFFPGWINHVIDTGFLQSTVNSSWLLYRTVRVYLHPSLTLVSYYLLVPSRRPNTPPNSTRCGSYYSLEAGQTLDGLQKGPLVGSV